MAFAQPRYPTITRGSQSRIPQGATDVETAISSFAPLLGLLPGPAGKVLGGVGTLVAGQEAHNVAQRQTDWVNEKLARAEDLALESAPYVHPVMPTPQEKAGFRLAAQGPIINAINTSRALDDAGKKARQEAMGREAGPEYVGLDKRSRDKLHAQTERALAGQRAGVIGGIFEEGRKEYADRLFAFGSEKTAAETARRAQNEMFGLDRMKTVLGVLLEDVAGLTPQPLVDLAVAYVSNADAAAREDRRISSAKATAERGQNFGLIPNLNVLLTPGKKA